MSELKQRPEVRALVRPPAPVLVPSGSQVSQGPGGVATVALPSPTFTFPDFKAARPGRLEGSKQREGLRWAKRYRHLLLVADALVITAVTAAAHLTRFGLSTASTVEFGNVRVDYLYISLAIAVAWMLALGLYKSRDTQIVGVGIDEYRRVVSASAMLLGLIALLCFVLNIDVARGFFALALPAGLIGLLVARCSLRQWLTRQRVRGHYLSRVIVLGRPSDVRYVVSQIEKKSGAAYKVVGVALAGGNGLGAFTQGGQVFDVVGDERSVVEAVASVDADAVVVAGPMKGGSRYIQRLGWKLEQSSTQLILTTGLTNVAGPRIHSRPVEGLPLMHVELPQYSGAKHAVKRMFDVVLAAVASVALLPVFVFLAVMIKRDSPGPVIFRQERVGRGGEKFHMLKFRSMVVTAEDDLEGLLEQNEGAGLLFKMQNDPRVTEVGRWMRKYSLDELPQLWNVLKGDMSLVGPRPPLQREVDKYQNKVLRRLYIKPGLTGMWQINGRSELNWRDSVRLDLYYVENWSLAGDLIIIWRTARMLMKPVGAY
ncbi:exopolysaccharide biosynthesis polyprenyl glycosylphosphotransferase [Arthrobacter sp. B3I9]|uniref:sugar transferase n=1 Tax=Arthrobacter sp. B3I9 TaxID=3042270 RepID=UPI0027924765|nr:sugar transferase [Arthrobacter sp. B3I9]MDQ0848572.1 exopolysaccharide biosynthesis polyprenyl glycosylphosphotransferase [Arthrobacter sp. B3I9]